MQRIKFDNNSIRIEIEKVPMLIKAILFSLTGLCLLMPIIVTYFMIHSGLLFGILLTFGFFWSVGFFVLRFVLWNSFGQENFTFEKDHISFYADFKLFKDSKKTLFNKGIYYDIIDEHSEMGRLVILNETDKIESSIKVSKNELTELLKKLNS